MRRIALLSSLAVPAMCAAYYGEPEPQITATDVFTWMLAFLFFILTIVALFKIISIAGDVRKISQRNVQGVFPTYYYLMGDKEKAREVMTQRMIASIEEKISPEGSRWIDQEYWKKEFEKIESEIPEPLKNVNNTDDYLALFKHEKPAEPK